MTGWELRPIPGLAGYFAGTDGTIWSMKPVRHHDTGHLHRLKTRIDRYAVVGPGGFAGKVYSVHRLVALTFYGPCPEGMQVCHLNHVKTDNRLENLMYGTHAENQAQNVAAGRQARGEQHGMARLTATQVAEIRVRLVAGETLEALGRVYGVTKHAIWRIKTGKTWRHLAAVAKPA